MEWGYSIKLIKILLEGLQTSLKIFSITLLFAIPIGIIVSILSISKNKIVSYITKIYILIMRGTPLLLQIICVYFAPYYLFKISYDRFVAIVIAFSLNYAAYFGEIFRSGIESISKGFGDKQLIKDFSYIVTRHDRIGIVGENGVTDIEKSLIEFSTSFFNKYLEN